MACNTTASLRKLSCPDCVDFGKCPERFRQFSWSKNDSNYLDVNLKVFKKEDNKEFRLVQNIKNGEVNFHQFLRLRNQLVNAAENFAREKNLSPVLIPALSKDMDENLKPAQNLFDVVDRANRKICATLLRYSEEEPENSYAQFKLFARKKPDEKCQQNVHVKYKFEEIIYLLDVIKSVFDTVIASKPTCYIP